MKKRMIAILLTFALTISGSAMAWAAPEDGTQESAVSEEGMQGSIVSEEGVQDRIVPEEGVRDSIVSEEVVNIEGIEKEESEDGGNETNGLDINEEGTGSDGIENPSDSLISESEGAEDGTGASEGENGDAGLNGSEPQAMTAENESGEELFAGGTGTAEDPYQITTAEQMNNVRKNLSASYVLMNDIDLSGYSNWEPIGTYEAPFVGIFDGNNYIITGFIIIDTIAGASMGESAGLFGCCYYLDQESSSAMIKNLKIKDASVKVTGKDGYINIGIISAEGGIIENCEVSGVIEILDSYDICVGGITGRAGNIKSCVSKVTIKAESTKMDDRNYHGEIWCGGISGSASKIMDSFNYGDIDAVGGNFLRCGGICGEHTSNIIHCANYGNIFGKTLYYDLVSSAHDKCEVGGIIGGGGKNIEECVNYGNIKVSESKGNSCSVGGISGGNGWDGTCDTITNCFNLGKIIDSPQGAGRICYSAKQIRECYSVETALINGAAVTVDIGADKPNGANLSEEEINKRIDELFSGKKDDDNTEQEAKEKAYIKDHVDFINSSDYAGRMNTCWAKTITQGLNTTAGKIGEAMYKTLNTGCEILKCESLSIFENPYDAVIAQLILAQADLEQKSFELKYKNNFLSFMSDLEKICEKADPNWSLKAKEYETGLEKILSDPKDYQTSNPAFYEICKEMFDKLYKNSNEDLNDLLNKYGKANDIFKTVNNYGNVVTWVADCIKYNSLVEAYLSTSDEFKQSLKDAVAYMARNAYMNRFTSYEDYCMRYAEAYDKFEKFQTEDQVKKLLFEEYVKNGFEKIGSVFGSTITKNVTVYATEKLGIPVEGASWFWAVVEAYKIGWGISEKISKNGKNMECRELARAYFYLEEAFREQVEADASKLQKDPTYKSAVEFDTSFCILRDLESSALDNYANFLGNQQDSILAFLNIYNEKFFNGYENKINCINEEKMQWKNIKCHDEYKRHRDFGLFNICCPTDVFVYDASGQLAFSIEKNTITAESDNIEGTVIDNMKFLVIPDISDYTLKITATDNGNMNYQVSIYDAATDNLKMRSNYLNVKLEKDDVFTGTFKEKISLIRNEQEIEPTSQIVDINDIVLVSSVAIEANKKILKSGDKMLLKAKISPENATFPVLSWRSSDESVAAVDENGMVTAVAAGKCTIQCVAVDGSGVYDAVELEIRADISGNGDKENDNTNDINTGNGSYVGNQGSTTGDSLNSDDTKTTIKTDGAKSDTKLKASADRAPNTGDEADFIIWGILALCGAGIYTMLIRKIKVS